MSTATDTNEQPNKRARFSENNNDTIPLPSSSNKVQPPKLLAESFIRAAIASLHSIIAPDVEKLAKEHILLLSKKLHLDKVSQRMVNDQDYIPNSARFKFELSCSDRAKLLPEYKAIEEKTSNIILQAQKDLRTEIINASKLEIKAITNDIQLHLIKTLRLFAQAFLLVNNDRTPVDEIVYVLAKDYIDNITVNVPMTLVTFVKLYKEVHTINTFPPTSIRTTAAAAPPNATTATGTTNTTNRTSSRYFPNQDQSQSQSQSESTSGSTTQQQPPENIIIINPNIKNIKDSFERIFVSSWTQYREQQTKNEMALELKKLTLSFFTTRATSDATMVVDAEPAADKTELKELIRLTTINETKNLLKQLNDMKKELNTLKGSKNSNQRGNGSASAKKTKSPTKTTKVSANKKKKNPTKRPPPSKKSNNSNKKGKVDGNNNEKESAVRNSKKKSGKKKSQMSGQSSNNNNKRRNNKSSNK